MLDEGDGAEKFLQYVKEVRNHRVIGLTTEQMVSDLVQLQYIINITKPTRNECVEARNFLQKTLGAKVLALINTLENSSAELLMARFVVVNTPFR